MDGGQRCRQRGLDRWRFLPQFVFSPIVEYTEKRRIAPSQRVCPRFLERLCRLFDGLESLSRPALIRGRTRGIGTYLTLR
jgi:hypothetical protein